MPAEPLRFVTREIDDPHDLLARLPEPDGLAWVREGEGLVGWGRAARFDVGPGDDRFARAAAAVGALLDEVDAHDEVRLPGTGPVAFVSLTFDPRSSGSVVVVPRVVLGRRAGRAWLTIALGPGEDPLAAVARALGAGPATDVRLPKRVRYAGAQVDELRWMESVAAATTAIRRGALAKVALARDVAVWTEERLDARALLRRLAARFPTCYAFACDGLVGATPELLVRSVDGEVESLCLAGTARRGEGDAEDAALAAALLASDKDRDEHELAVASVRDVLAPRLDGLEVDGPWLLRLANVQHLATSVRGRARGGAPALELAAALHPTAAVCGTPRDVALRMIRELEGFDRGRYAGPVGWVDARGDGELGIALRCAQLDGARARLYAGCGIVAGSLPEAELEETRLKLRAMQSALADAPGS